MKICSSIAVIVFIVVLGGCGGAGDATNAARTSAGPEADATPGEAETETGYPVPQAPPQKGPLTKLGVKNIAVGNGSAARWGDEVAVRYVGLNYETGEVYVRHWKGLDPLAFKLDGKSFGVGWQQGIEGMRVGSRRELLIPKHLLFGDEDVAYVVELLRVSKSKATANSFPAEGPFSVVHWVKGKKPQINPPDKSPPRRLVFRDLSVGSGPAAHRGDEVDIEYFGAVYKTGALGYGGTTQPFALGSGGLGGGFEDGIEGMEPGGRRELIVPSRLLDGTPAIDYVIRMESVKPAAGP